MARGQHGHRAAAEFRRLIGQLLKMKDILAPQFAGAPLNSAQYMHLTAEMEKRVYADRVQYLGDPDFFQTPINLFLSRLNEPQRRWFVALEALRIGHGGKHLLAQITGMSPTTILRGCHELEAELADCPDAHLRMPGGGRPAAEQRDPRLEESLEALLASETAGDPMGRRPMAKSSSLRHLSAALKKKGHTVSPPTVSKLLRKLKYSPKVNARRTEVRGASAAQRHEQFAHINEQREDFHTTGDPIISVDTKKKK